MSRWSLIYDAHGKHILDDKGVKRPYRWYHALADFFHGLYYNHWVCRHWNRQQALSKRKGARYYGNGGTIHQGAYLDVEVHEGRVMSVWFRCQPLAYKVRRIDKARADEMRRMTLEGEGARLSGVEVVDKEKAHGLV